MAKAQNALQLLIAQSADEGKRASVEAAHELVEGATKTPQPHLAPPGLTQEALISYLQQTHRITPQMVQVVQAQQQQQHVMPQKEANWCAMSENYVDTANGLAGAAVTHGATDVALVNNAPSPGKQQPRQEDEQHQLQPKFQQQQTQAQQLQLPQRHQLRALGSDLGTAGVFPWGEELSLEAGWQTRMQTFDEMGDSLGARG